MPERHSRRRRAPHVSRDLRNVFLARKSVKHNVRLIWGGGGEEIFTRAERNVTET